MAVKHIHWLNATDANQLPRDGTVIRLNTTNLKGQLKLSFVLIVVVFSGVEVQPN